MFELSPEYLFIILIYKILRINLEHIIKDKIR